MQARKGRGAGGGGGGGGGGGSSKHRRSYSIHETPTWRSKHPCTLNHALRLSKMSYGLSS